MKQLTTHELLALSMEVVKKQTKLILSLQAELDETSKKLIVTRKELMEYHKRWLYLKKNKKRPGRPA